jgi:pheromone shutdown protein TraB
MADVMLSLNDTSQVIVAVVGVAHIFGIESILVNQGGYHLHRKD